MPPLEKLLQIRILFPCFPIANNSRIFTWELFEDFQYLWDYWTEEVTSNLCSDVDWRLYLFKISKLTVALQENPNSKIILFNSLYQEILFFVRILSTYHASITFSEVWSEASKSIICAQCYFYSNCKLSLLSLHAFCGKPPHVVNLDKN